MQQETEFTRGDSGEIRTPEGLPLGFTHYKTADGTPLIVFYGGFADRGKAERALEQQSAKATRTLESGTKQDATGNVVGLRKIVEYKAEKGKAPLFGLIWTDGLAYHEIRSYSMKFILEFEKTYKY